MSRKYIRNNVFVEIKILTGLDCLTLASCQHQKWVALIATSIEPGQPAHSVGWPTLSFQLDIPNNDDGKCQKCKMNYSI